MKIAPNNIENWCLDDIVKIYTSIYFEQEEHRLLEQKMQRDMGK